MQALIFSRTRPRCFVAVDSVNANADATRGGDVTGYAVYVQGPDYLLTLSG